MGILKVIGLTKAFGPDTVFEDVSFELQRGAKAGMIGANGTGKSTLLKVMLGQEEADGGRVILPEEETIAYLQQESDFAQSGGTLFQELLSAYQDVLDMQQQMNRLEAVMSAETDSAVLEDLMKKYSLVTARFEHAGGYGYENNIRRVAAGLGFTSEDLERRTTEFSGGQKTRIALAKALLRRPDYLFLDEPTNHLDIAMVEWLEEYLREYAGGVLIVSHDRYFLDRVADRILELEDRRLTEYDGNYSRYLRQKAERLEAQLAAYDKQQAYIAKTEAFIERYRAGIKSKQARGRQSQLDRLERVDAPLENRSFAFTFTNLTESADRVAEMENISAAYRERTIFKQQNLLIRRGDGVALIGPNGAGKTTLLKLFTGDLSPAEGRVKLGSRVKIGYFSQEHEGLNPRRQVIEEIMLDFGTNEERARGYLGVFLFSGDDVFKLVGELSGGEKARLALLKLMLAGPNFLIMDEPTNHLDIPAKEAVEAAILSYAGTYLIVSHDRYFLDKVADRVVELAGGTLTEYSGNYSYYREKKVALEKEQEKIKPAATEKPEKTTKPAAARRRPPDKAKMLQKMEQEIRALEVEVQCLEAKLNDPATYDNHELAKAMAEEYEAKKKQLDDQYEVWLEYTEMD